MFVLGMDAYSVFFLVINKDELGVCCQFYVLYTL